MCVCVGGVGTTETLQSGSSGIKTASEHDLYGGVVGVPYDGCSLLPCDTTGNVNTAVLEANLHALATVLQELLSDATLRTHLAV